MEHGLQKLLTSVAAGLALALALTVSPAAAAPAAQDDRLVPSSSATVGEPHTNIIGGHGATESYSAMASLEIVRGDDANYHICGGTLVFHRWVEINAHCVTQDDGTPYPAAMFHVRIGSGDRTTGGVVVGVAEILPHAEWDWATGTDRVADITMLRLDTYVQLQPIEIPTRLGKPKATTRLLGWGITEPSMEGPLPNALQELDSRLIGATNCAGAAGGGGITAGELCVASVNGTDGPCYGDSGGPAMQQVTAKRWQLVGSASRETGEFCGTGPTIYTDLAYYRNWVYEVARTGKVPPREQGIVQPKALIAQQATGWLLPHPLHILHEQVKADTSG